MNERNDPDTTYRRCACCQDGRTTCSPGCLIAPYFPHHMKPAFKNVQDVFMLGTIFTKLRPLDAHQRNILMKNLINEANLRKKNTVRGCFGVLRSCRADVQRLKNKVESQATEINHLRHNLAWGNIVQASHPQQIGSAQRQGYVRPGQIAYLGQEYGQASSSHQQHHRRTRPRLVQESGQASISHQQHHRRTRPRLGQESGQPSTSLQQLHPRSNHLPPGPRNQQWGNIVQASHQQQIGSAALRQGYVHPGPNQGQIPIFGQVSTSHQQLGQDFGQASTIHQQLHPRTNQGLSQEEDYLNLGQVANLGQEFGEASTSHQQLHPGTNQGLVQQEYLDFGYDIGQGNFAHGQMNQQGGNIVQGNFQAPTNHRQLSQQPNQEQGNMNRFQ